MVFILVILRTDSETHFALKAQLLNGYSFQQPFMREPCRVNKLIACLSFHLCRDDARGMADGASSGIDDGWWNF